MYSAFLSDGAIRPMYSVILGEPAISPKANIRIAARVNITFCVTKVNAIPIEHTRNPAVIVFNGLYRITKLETII